MKRMNEQRDQKGVKKIQNLCLPSSKALVIAVNPAGTESSSPITTRSSIIFSLTCRMKNSCNSQNIVLKNFPEENSAGILFF